MKKNRIAIILVIILGSISFWFITNKRSGTIKQNLKDFAVDDTASVNKIFLADKQGRTITLERTAPGQWIVNNKYNARMDVVETLLSTIKKIDVKEPVGKKAQDNIVKRLSAQAIRCEIYQNNVLTKAYYVGTETQDQTGTYMILIDLKTMLPAAKPFVTYIPGFEGYLTTRYITDEAAWRDRSIFQYTPNDIRSIKMEAPHKPELSYEVIVKGNNDYEVKMLSDNKTLNNIDTFALNQYLSYFQKIIFENFEDIKQTKIDSTLKSEPLNILTVTDNSGKTNKIKLYARTNKKNISDETGKPYEYDPDRMSALLDNGKDFVIVQYLMFGKLLPPPDYFQKKSRQIPEKTKEKNKPKT
ncbi:MAG: hypothetical protein ACT4ON_03595 [Bacteroidota bacterium]